MEDVRVLLAGIPTGMLGEIVEKITELRPHMKVVAHASRAELPQAVGRYQADVVILGLDVDELPDVCTELLDGFPETVVIGIAADGRRTVIHVDNVGPDELLDTIRVVRKRHGGSASPSYGRPH